MVPIILTLRVLHIVFGAFWVGAAVFFTFIVEPRVRALGPAVQGPVMRALVPVMVPALTASGLIAIGAGIGLALVLQWDNLGFFFSSAWGWSIIVGLVASVAAAVVGMVLNRRMALQMEAVTKGIQGRAPTPEEGQQLGQLGQRLRALARITSVLLLIAVIAMAVARFV